MYQLVEAPAVDNVSLFLQTCTSMPATPENVRCVRNAAAVVRSAVESGDVAPLRRLLRQSSVRRAGAADVLAAAGDALIDEIGPSSRYALHDLVRRIADVERAAIAPSRSASPRMRAA